MVANMNVEKFIEDIYERPVIWNRSYSGNKPYLDETWTEMAQLHQLGSKCLCPYHNPSDSTVPLDRFLLHHKT